jgi:guanylate kinase
MNKLYLITGPAGVGKSTVSKAIADNLNKSALIEGDDIYNMIISGHVNPWLDGNHLDLMWKNSISLIKNFLNDGFDVVFNYIINKKNLEMIKREFNNYDLIFVVLLVDEETIIKRDKERPLDVQMGIRSLELLKEFKNENFEEKYILNTTNLSIDETMDAIKNDERFNLYN